MAQSYISNSIFGRGELVNTTLSISALLNCDLTTTTSPNIGSASNPMNDIYCKNLFASGGTSTSANLNVTNLTVANLIGSNINTTSIIGANGNFTNLTVGTLTITNFLLPSATIANLVSTNTSIATLIVTNESVSNETVSNLNVSNSTVSNTHITNAILTSSTVSNSNVSNQTISNSNITNLTVGTLNTANISTGNIYLSGTLTTVNTTSVNIIDTNISSGTIVNSGLINSLNYTGTNATIGIMYNAFLTAAGIFATTITSTNIYTGTLSSASLITSNMTTANFYASNISYGNAFGTSLSVGTIYATTVSSASLITTNQTVSNLLTTNQTISNLLGTNITISNLNTTNITASSINISAFTTSNLVTTNFSAANIYINSNATMANLKANTLLSTTLNSGNSNTLGSIITTGGNTGVGITPLSGDLLDVFTSANSGVIRFIGSNMSIYLQDNTAGSHSLIMAVPNTNTFFSTSAIAGDIVFRSSQNMMLQNGGGSAAIYIATSGNVGINNGAPAFNLDITGNARVTGSFSAASFNAASKLFTIPHPLNKFGTLRHMCIESPRADCVYRGSKKLSNGNAYVDLDKESSSSGMTAGTFESLIMNPQVFVSCNTKFENVVARVEKSNLHIKSQDPNSFEVIDWLVIGERKDKHIMEAEFTDSNGHFIPESF